ncbi:UDP-3-O-acyl-N-acetylglucosamine deacetylase [Candidatus Woesearchaeota archaeon]|nr:UDP-3-O-acyl-N-acetylglucosamine deacetylase [Candidatus Woesearchaeota archaeon]
MQLQHTLDKQVEIVAREVFGGCKVRLTLSPAQPDTGIVFRTSKGEVKADIKHAFAYDHTMILDNGKVRVAYFEHMLATLFAYGIDNCYADIERTSGFFKFLQKIGIATDIEMVPTPEDRELTLCNLLDRNVVAQEGHKRKLVTLNKKVGNENLSLYPIEGDGLKITVITDYPLPGREKMTFEITRETYKKELSEARAYAQIPHGVPVAMASIQAALSHPRFGIGHGYKSSHYPNGSNLFLPASTKEEWRMQEVYGAEVLRHSVVDRAAIPALIPGRLCGVEIRVYRSGHVNNLFVTKEYVVPNLVSKTSS